MEGLIRIRIIEYYSNKGVSLRIIFTTLTKPKSRFCLHQ